MNALYFILKLHYIAYMRVRWMATNESNQISLECYELITVKLDELDEIF